MACVLAKVGAAVAARTTREGRGGGPQSVRLVAVSKTKPVELLSEAYEAGHRHFGENYVQELVQKAPELPEDIKWHFIGRLQSNKVSSLIKGCPKLACVETVTSEKLARALNKAVQLVSREEKLRVMIQVNSSGEESKGGIEPRDCVALATFIARECEHLELAGFMTIGAPDYSGCRTEDFETLHTCRREAAAALTMEEEGLELSMGMSNDFENAILEGSTSVRVGSSIFGARDYSAK